MDFFRVGTRESRKKGGPTEVYADYTVGRSSDLMVQGGAFYAVWNAKLGLWSRQEYDVQILVDQLIREKMEELKAAGVECDPKYLRSFENGGWEKFRKFLRNIPDNSHPIDARVTFADTVVKKSDYASRRLPYSMAPGDISAYEELVNKLYTPEERMKFEWAIGAIIHGDAKKIQKFLVFFGAGGTGKSTIMDLISLLFGGKVKDGGYVAHFDAQALTGSSNAFATAAFKDNPLVAIQHDGDLSKIETNARLNAIVSHEEISINEKFKTAYDNKINAMLFMGTNKPVQITDAKSGLIRRLIDVNPTGDTFEPDHYYALIQRVEFQLGAIAHHCLQVYKRETKNKYSDYTPQSMMLRTDAMYNYIDEHFDVFRDQACVTLTQAWGLYNKFCEDSKLPYSLSKIKFREALKDYFAEFHDRTSVDGIQTRSVYKGFKGRQFKTPVVDSKTKVKTYSLVMDETESILDEMYAGLPAQYQNSKGNPAKYWTNTPEIKGEVVEVGPERVCSTVLGDLDTSKLHFVRVPENHIIIDFDLRDEDGNKSLELNREAASIGWPPTYAEVSKSGEGVHLHYIWDGDVDKLAHEYSEGIEIKVLRGSASLRRKLTKCNNIAVATISGGLPLKENKMLQEPTLRTETGLRKMIIRTMRKEFHTGTKPAVDFIEHLLRQAYKSGTVYDVTDMIPIISQFAASSRNQSATCVQAVARMDFKSELTAEEVDERFDEIVAQEERIVFFDCEVYPNLFVICWKYQGSDTVVRMINPTPAEVQNLIQNFKLVGFNNRGYDNHIMWARMLGASIEDLYQLSQRIIVFKDDNAKFGQAWNASYADVYDFSSNKMTLKKWEIVLGIPHIEMDIPWDKPVPENKIDQVVDYCCNDVMALEAVWDACNPDFIARQILADMSGLTVNHSTRMHVLRILFGNERNPQKQFVYTDLSEMFPGYKFDKYAKTDKSTYQGEVIGEGGYVYAEPGMYENVAVLDIASMHPTSIEMLNLFGPYTVRFSALKEARISIKNGDFEYAKGLLEGKLRPHIEDIERAAVQSLKEKKYKTLREAQDALSKPLSDALKLGLNSTYGYTCAKFDNPAKDPRNIDNIVAKRGALFMVNLKKAVQERGFTVAHIKTDSIKIPNATAEIIKFVKDFGLDYGYEFVHEANYKKMCLVNDAVLIAYVGWNEKEKPEHWKAVGAEFQHPYVFKTLFSDEPISFKDLCETKQVKKGAMYLKYPEGDLQIGEPKDDILTFDRLVELAENPDVDPSTEDMHIGRSGLFVAINPDQNIMRGGELVVRRDDIGDEVKDYAVPGTKGHLWAEAETVRELQDGAIDRLVFERLEDAVEGTGSIADVVDMAYYNKLVKDAAESIEKFGDFEGFVK